MTTSEIARRHVNVMDRAVDRLIDAAQRRWVEVCECRMPVAVVKKVSK